MRIGERVHPELAQTTRFGDIRWLDVVDSTNRIAAEAAAAGAAEGLVVVADHQTEGRGRLGRRWEAPAGSALLMSVLLRPERLEPARFHLMTAAVGLAAAGACRAVGGFAPDIKWPNDLLVGGRKLAGVLAEVVNAVAGDGVGSAAAGKGVPAVVVGLGLNLSAAPHEAITAEEAAGRRVGRDDMLVAVLEELDGRLGHWDEVAAAYRSECATVGRRVRVEGHDGVARTGPAVRVDDGGRLVVSFEGDGEGEETALSAGDVVHLGPAAGTGW